MVMRNPVNHIIDADIKGFFDNVDHRWMLRCLQERISDRNLLRLIVRFLKAGVMEDGKYLSYDAGTPQGGILSPILANIYLHFVLDLWMAKEAKRAGQGYIGIVRYADDFIICVQKNEVAKALLAKLKERLNKFGLELSEEKTRLIEFGRYAATNAGRKGQKPKTFNFLGFTHYCGTGRSGKFKVGRSTDRKKFLAKLREMKDWFKSVRDIKIRDWWPVLRSKIRGHFRYYGVSDNSKGIKRFLFEVTKLAFKWLNRRSQRRSFNWEKFNRYLKLFPLPQPKIYHSLYTL